MAQLFVQISISADGFIEDAAGKLDWFTEDQAVEGYATETLRAIGGMVFGKTAHVLLASSGRTRQRRINRPIYLNKRP